RPLGGEAFLSRMKANALKDNSGLLRALRENYPVAFDKIEMFRDGGSVSYAVYSRGERYFLRMVKPAFRANAVTGVEIQSFLSERGFPVPPVVPAFDGRPFAEARGELFMLYGFIEGCESDPERDAEKIGALIGRLHLEMRNYAGDLIMRDKQYYVGRYVDILQSKDYPRSGEFAAYGEALWDRLKGLRQGYNHGDLYRGNIHADSSGRLFLLDFDTSCMGFPMYDSALICNMTDYFELSAGGFDKSKAVLARFLPEYLKYCPLSENEIDSFGDLIALYHFALQATIIELHGPDCVDSAFFDRQLEWLTKWSGQREQSL
ncbi:MAG: phosphotransferase, partial [Defluviitaleaceae bacterium]|nr:phosphotransferase [Defluviitaleaceae bacterium]